MPVEIIDTKKKNQVEVLLVTKRTRAKGEDDEGLARIYEPGEEIRIKGSGKLSLLALGKATRNLDAKIEETKSGPGQTKKTVQAKANQEADKTPAPKLNNMSIKDLEEYADVSLGLNVKNLKTKPEKIAAIKVALTHASN